MQRLNVTNRKHQQLSGFTLLEILVAVVMVGIVSAIATPGMLGFLNRSKVSAAHSALQGGLQEIQREAIKRGTNCEITFPTSGNSAKDQTNSVLIISSNCLITGDLKLESVRIRHNLPSTTIDLFNFKGDTDPVLSNNAVIVITQEDNNAYQKCIAISDGLGLIRIGNYPPGDTTVNPNNCSPTS